MAMAADDMYEDEVDLRTPLLQLGDDVPNFSCDTTQGFVTLHDTIQGKWVMIFTMPKNLDPISVSALAAVAKLKEEFDARNVSVYGLGVDSKMNHKVWVSDTYELQEERVNFPIIVDDKAQISKAFGLVRPNETDFMHALVPCMLCVVIDPDLKMQYMAHYPMSTGHNYKEVLRVIDSLQLTREHPVCTPANWMVGEDIFIKAEVSLNEASERFVKGFLEIRNWFRLTAVPD
mmetsp:Transcript_21267/g.54902  ORF Transcript_21267/g.54902 Transcript_21267/m.54902 type:complete len:232 (-) Transcript_21267:214-909(-)|eukprot:CAMPEP_0119474610 /NCGR_PEP_ID=MMETSP1344-20130328/5798_1 /TAXON_ID=236787 /ORGANISM="Florenciella parvula, Strain CCMP2471" /LENGTH=231 /DNA_ID=CAMNT_0007507937 /DNA_START=250 /DNA_END=945 /DNA_ORIENTATION=-